jgi:hypothetical protein
VHINVQYIYLHSIMRFNLPSLHIHIPKCFDLSGWKVFWFQHHFKLPHSDPQWKSGGKLSLQPQLYPQSATVQNFGSRKCGEHELTKE